MLMLSNWFILIIILQSSDMTVILFKIESIEKN